MDIKLFKVVRNKYEGKSIKVINKTEKDLFYVLPIVCNYCADISKVHTYIIKAKDFMIIPFLDVFTPFGATVEDVQRDVTIRIDGFFSNITFEQEELVQYMKEIPIMYNVKREL